MKKITVRSEGRYMSHAVKKNKIIDITFKMPYTELTNYIQTIQMLNENVVLGCKIGSDKKPIKLGEFMIKDLKVDGDGEGTIKLNSQLDFVNANLINDLAMREDEPLTIMFRCDIDLEEESEEDPVEE